MTTKKTTNELLLESTLFSRHAAELRRTGMALIKQAAQLQRDSEATLRRLARLRKGTRKRR